jgi:hypothetical protein
MLKNFLKSQSENTKKKLQHEAEKTFNEVDEQTDKVFF